jgi:membrane-associated protein
MMVGVSATSRIKFTLIDVLACAIWATGLGLLVVGLDTLMLGFNVLS